jgi:TonB family protein
MDMVVIGRPLETYDEEISAQFVPVSAKPFEGHVNQTVDTHEPAILWSNPPLMPDEAVEKQKDQASREPKDARVRPPALDLAKVGAEKRARERFLEGATEISLRPTRSRQVILETGSLGAAFAQFDQCNEDSLKDWGFDPAIEAKIARPAWAINPSDWLFANDYPEDLIRRGEESVVAVRLLIDATGKVTKCTPLSHYEETEFNKISCMRISQRARFEPAELADGTKVPTYYTRRVVFRIARY